MKKESDNHVLVSVFQNIAFKTNKIKHEMYNLKNIDCRKSSRNSHHIIVKDIVKIAEEK